MTNINSSFELDSNVDEDDDDFIFDDEDWEDSAFPQKISDEYPGWHQLKITNFTTTKLKEIREWCKTHIKGSWEEVGWRSGCSYSVGIVVERGVDAMMFKLRWT